MTWPFSDRLATSSSLSDLSSFSEFLRREAPQLLPTTAVPGAMSAGDALPHGTTIVALRYPGGVLIAGDRR